MDDETSPIDLAMAAGRFSGAAAIAPTTTRAAAAQRQLAAIWDAFRHDAGSGPVGREHLAPTGLIDTDDPRRDGLLLWLAGHADPLLAEAATIAARAVGAVHRFDADQLDLLAAAVELMPRAPDNRSVTKVLAWLKAYLDVLRGDERFAESEAERLELSFPTGRIETVRAAAPGGCWAANLALQIHPVARLIPPGTLSRVQFRLDLEAADRAEALAEYWSRGLQRGETELFFVHRELARGSAALAGLSKNARARDVWALLVGLGALSRARFARALSLSRAGAALIAQQLVEAGLARIEHGKVLPAQPEFDSGRPLDGRLAVAAAAVDAAMESLDKLLNARR